MFTVKFLKSAEPSAVHVKCCKGKSGGYNIPWGIAAKVEKTIKEYKEGKMKSGSIKKVKRRKQPIAIGLSEARKRGAKVLSKKS